MKEAFDIVMLVDNPMHSDRRVERQAKSLTMAGISVLVLAERSGENVPPTIERDGYEVRRIIQPYFLHPLRKASYAEGMSKLLAELRSLDFKLLYCHDYLLLPAAAEFKRNNPSITLVYDSHEFLSGWPLYKEIPHWWNRLKGRLTWSVMKRREQSAMRHVDLLLAPSEAIRIRQAKSLPSHAQSFSLRNIPDHEGLDSSKQASIRETHKLPESAVIAVLSGNIYQPDCSFFDSLEALMNEPKLHLIIIGNRPRHADIKRKCSKSKTLSTRVHFMDFNSEQLHGLLSQCDFGIAYTRTTYLAHRIGSSNRLMEYTLAGLPILGTHQQAHQEMQRDHGHVVLFEADNSESFRNGLTEMLSSLDILKPKAEAAAVTLNWTTEYQPILEWIKKKLSGMSLNR